MAVEIRKALAITGRDSSPRTLSNGNISKGNLVEAVGTVETVNADSAGSTYIFAQIPSNARVSQLLLYADDIGTTTAADFGLYETTENGGTVVDADLFASAVALNAAVLTASDITHESGVFGFEDCEKMVWEALGLATDPCKNYDVVATLTGAADAAGTIALKIRYAV